MNVVAHSMCVFGGRPIALERVCSACCPGSRRGERVEMHTVEHSVGQDWQVQDDAVKPEEAIIADTLWLT